MVRLQIIGLYRSIITSGDNHRTQRVEGDRVGRVRSKVVRFNHAHFPHVPEFHNTQLVTRHNRIALHVERGLVDRVHVAVERVRNQARPAVPQRQGLVGGGS